LTPRSHADDDDTLSVPAGRVLILGPSRSGKTIACARALAAYLNANGPHGVAVLDFAPAYRTDDGRVIGERIERYLSIPPGVLHFVVPTRAPRASTKDPAAALAIAKENAVACNRVLERLPGHIGLERIGSAHFAVLTALDPVHFDDRHPITIQERAVIAALERQVEHVLRTGDSEQPEAATRKNSAEAAP
jgi:hypothetical protein